MLRLIQPLSDLWIRRRQEADPRVNNTPFSPNYADICTARALLASCGLPMELVLEILAWANSIPSKACINAGVLSYDTLITLQTPQASVYVKEIEFTFHSRDQGWTSEGTDGTFTTSSWLEVSIVRPVVNVRSNRPASSSGTEFFVGLNLYPDPVVANNGELIYHRYPADLQHIFSQRGTMLVERPEEVSHGIQEGEGNVAWYLQGNQVAVATGDNWPEYRVVWSSDDYEGNEGAGDGRGFIDALQDGDSIIVWARAKYPGWQCNIKDITVTVRYGYHE